MIAAQGYQESLLDQSKKNPSGAVGIMQVVPKNAAAAPINITNVGTADGNIHAGVKMLRNIEETYFNDPKIDSLNKTLFVFASYNAGPNRIARLRKKASDMGLDPNVWFNNVEIVAAKDIGQETVTYVANLQILRRLQAGHTAEGYPREGEGAAFELVSRWLTK